MKSSGPSCSGVAARQTTSSARFTASAFTTRGHLKHSCTSETSTGQLTRGGYALHQAE